MNDLKNFNLPEQIRKAAREEKLLFFIGNGLSRCWGASSWDEFADNMLRTLVYENGGLNYAQSSLIKQEKTKIKLSIANKYFLEAMDKFPDKFCYEEVLKSEKTSKEFSNVYEILAQCNAQFVTTNYDLGLKNAIEKDANMSDDYVNTNGHIRERPHILSHKEIESGKIPDEKKTTIYLHGLADNPKSMIVSIKDYLYLYGRCKDNGENKVINKVRSFLCDKTIIFLGYGMDEHEILELIYRHQISSNVEDYMFLPLYSYQKNIESDLYNYFSQLNIHPFFYKMDDIGHEQFQYDLVCKLASAISIEQRSNDIDSLYENIKTFEQGENE